MMSVHRRRSEIAGRPSKRP